MKRRTLYDKLWASDVVTDYGDGEVLVYFDVPNRGKILLLSGLEITAEILANESNVMSAFEQQQRLHMPWLYLNPA